METYMVEKLSGVFGKPGFPGGKKLSSRWLLATGSGYDF